MARPNIHHPTALLGRYVRGVESLNGLRYPFEGIVECVSIPAPGFRQHCVEFFVDGQFISQKDCVVLEFV